MLSLFSDGFKTCTAEDRINYGTKLDKELREFINSFLPHMKEEEEVRELPVIFSVYKSNK